MRNETRIRRIVIGTTLAMGVALLSLGGKCGPDPQPTPTPTPTATATPTPSPTPEPTPEPVKFFVGVYAADGSRHEENAWPDGGHLVVREAKPLGYDTSVLSAFDFKTANDQTLTQQIANMPPYIAQDVREGIGNVLLLTICAGCDVNTHWFGPATAKKTCTGSTPSAAGHGYCRTSLPDVKGLIVGGVEVIDPTIPLQLGPWKPEQNWKNVKVVFYGDELGNTKAQVEAQMTDYRAQEKALGLSPKMVCQTFTHGQLDSLDGHLAENLPCVVLEAYGGGCGEGNVEADMEQQIAHIPAGKIIGWWRPTYDHNGVCAGKGPQIANLALRVTNKVMELRARSERLAAFVTDFCYVRGKCQNGWCQGGSRDYLDWFRDILTCTARWMLGGPNTCKPATEPTPAPMPKPGDSGGIGWDRNSVGAAESQQTQALTIIRAGAGSAAPDCTVHYTVSRERGTNVGATSGSVVVRGQNGTASVPVTRPADPAASGPAVARVDISAEGCVANDRVGRVTWFDAQSSLTWLSLRAVVEIGADAAARRGNRRGSDGGLHAAGG